MNRKELVDCISDSAGISKIQADKALQGTLEGITKSLKEKESVTLVGFGAFSTVDREARKGRNPQTGKPIDIPAKTVVKFKVGKSLGDQVNNG
ncbi:MAG: HU family DNA-binding protein [Desulforhopalus sp.]